MNFSLNGALGTCLAMFQIGRTKTSNLLDASSAARSLFRSILGFVGKRGGCFGGHVGLLGLVKARLFWLF